ncbi:MAG: ATP-binding protein [Candidatus Aenigmarchaeota archaeon]|nr:ATP-binding protein [Candidatus Aenigmarchaeota archaeon]
MFDIIIGRDEEDKKKYGGSGCGFIAKHFVGNKNEAHLTNQIKLDLCRPHIVGLFGKRGQGKSFSMGTIAEELMMLPDGVSDNIGTVMIDTMGIFWSMKRPNEKDAHLLADWNIYPRGFNVNICIPEGLEEKYKEENIDYDMTFAFTPRDLDLGSWSLSFNIDLDSEMGILLTKVVRKANESGVLYSLDDMIDYAKEETSSGFVKEALINRFLVAKDWGIFKEREEGTSIYDIVLPGRVTIVDISRFKLAVSSEGGWSVKALVVALLARIILQERMRSRRLEELEEMEGKYVGQKLPITWMLVDEAHQFLPRKGMTPASLPLLQWVKIGREPGVSLLLATQMPNKLHEEAVSQCDVLISHRLTSKKDILALSEIMQSYLRKGIGDFFDDLPRLKGAAIILDDNSEHIYSMRMRPRMSWHAGGSPIAIKKSED